MHGDAIVRCTRSVSDKLSGADALLITAGAGMSVDSGLPDFRGNHGFWRAYPPLKDLGISFERMAQPYWFAEKPWMAWAWYGHRWQMYCDANPHAGYGLLRDWAESMKSGAYVVTSNVDGHFAKAGFSERGIVEVHGSVHRLQCVEPCSNEIWEAGLPDLRIDLAKLTAEGELPRCRKCGGLARPNVLMFNDAQWVDDVTRQQTRGFDQWLSRVRGKRLVILELGAGNALPTIRRLGERIAERSLTTLVRINPDARQEDDSIIALPLGALEALTMIQEARKSRRGAAAAKPMATATAAVASGGGEASTVRKTSRQSAAQPTGFRMPVITEVDFDTGISEALVEGEVSDADQQVCFEALFRESVNPRRVPELSSHAPSGYVFHVEDGSPGAVAFYLCAPSGEKVMTFGVGRRAPQSGRLWQSLHAQSAGGVQPLDYPREPWIARLMEDGAKGHRAMAPELAKVGRALAVTWLRGWEYEDYKRRRSED